MERAGRLYLHSEQDDNQRVGSSNPTWRDLGGRHAETGTDGEEVAGLRGGRGEEEEEER